MKKNLMSSSVVKKFVMGITGLLLVGFIVTHLLGNLLLYRNDGQYFNEYAAKLASFGIALYAAEALLTFFFLYHAVTGLRLAFSARKARPTHYAVAASKGGGSHWGLAANNMAITGVILLGFLIFHVIHFKYGKGIAEGYVVQVAGAEERDLQRFVVEEFQDWKMVALYVVTMTVLGIHLKHGIWSALHTLGLTRPNNSGTIYTVGGAIGILLAVGFLLIPLYLFFFGAS